MNVIDLNQIRYFFVDKLGYIMFFFLKYFIFRAQSQA